MGRPCKERKHWDELSTLWEVPEALWAQLAPVVAEVDAPKPTGRPRIDPCAVLNAILFRLRSGCQWNRLPERFPTIGRCIGPSSGGCAWGCSRASVRCW